MNTAFISMPTPRLPKCLASTDPTASSASHGASSTPSRKSANSKSEVRRRARRVRQMVLASFAETSERHPPCRGDGRYCSCPMVEPCAPVAISRSARKPNRLAHKRKPNIAPSSSRSTPSRISPRLASNGQWHYVSPQVDAILGYTPEEWLAISHKWDELIHPDDLATVRAAEEGSARGEPFQAEFRVKRKDGREVWLNDTGGRGARQRIRIR